jgi:hypothetical protein
VTESTGGKSLEELPSSMVEEDEEDDDMMFQDDEGHD